MTVTTTNLIQGPATLWVGVFGVTEPATVSTAPGTGWTELGATKDGVAVSVEMEFSDLTVDQIVDLAGTRTTKRQFKLVTNLAEATLANYAIALNELAATVVANKFTPSSGLAAFQPAYVALLCDGIGVGGFRRRIISRKMVQTGSVEASYKKEDELLFPVEFAGYYVSSSIAPFSVEDATS